MSPVPSERGQATPLIAIVLLVAALALVPVGLVAKATIERAEARTAADAAALAGALHGERSARELAEANGGRLTEFAEHGEEIEVTVELGGRRATARAVRETVVVPPD